MKGKSDSEKTSGFTSNCMEKVPGPCIDQCVDKMSCDSTTETGEESIFGEEKMSGKSSQKIPVEFKAFSSDEMECESSSASLNSVDTVQVTTQSKSEINLKSDNEQTCINKLETHSSISSPNFLCNNSVNNLQVYSFGRRRNAKAFAPHLRRTVVSDMDDVDGNAQAVEMEVSSTIKLGCEESQNLDTNIMFSDNSVTSSHEISASQMHGSEMDLSRNSFQRQEVAMLQKQIINSNKNIPENSVSGICTKNSVKALKPKPLSICLKTPGFGDDIIRSVEEVAIHEKYGQDLNKQRQDVTCKSQDIVQETMEESEVKTASDVLTGDVTVSDMDNGQQVEGQKQDCNLLCKDYDGEEEEDEEGFNDDVICTHGKLNCEVLIITMSLLKILTVIALHAFGYMMGILCFCDTMLHCGAIASDYPVTWHHFLEEWNSRLHCYVMQELVNMIIIAISTRMSWAVHVACMGGMRSASNNFLWGKSDEVCDI